MDVAILGSGCFWCAEAVFQNLKGVINVIPGYAGGSEQIRTAAAPTYDQVSTEKTGYAEVVKVEFDPAQISYRDLLTVFFATHDPTTLNRQGADVGTQYRSIILYTNEKQKKEARKYIEELNGSGPKVVTELTSLHAFYEAEDYHRDYYKKNPQEAYCQIVISPKLELIRKKFDALLNHD